MNTALLSFIISLIIVMGISFIFAIFRQRQINKNVRSSPVSGADNHVMKERSGKYSVCKCIGEADEEF